MPDEKNKDLEMLEARHPLHSENLNRWQFMMAAYEGVEAMLAWGVLKKNERESDENHKARLEEAFGFDYTKTVVELFACHLFRKAPSRDFGTLEKDTLFQQFMDDCDLYGTDFDQFLKQQQTFASVYGHIGILVDKPQGQAQSRKDETDKGLYPYVAAYHPHAILDWKYERNPETNRPRLAYLKLQDEDGRYRLWWPDKWEVWEVADKKAEKVESGANSLGEIPFVWFFNIKSRKRNIGTSDVAAVARIDASIIRNCSHGEEVIKWAAFPQMRKPMRRAGDESEDEVGPTAILEFDPEHPESRPDWLEAEVQEPIEAILKWMERKGDAAFDAVNAGGVKGTEASTAARSGLALKYEFMQLNAKLVAKAQNAQEAELAIFYFWNLWMGNKDAEVKVEWPTKFDVEDLATDLENALTSKTLVGSETFRNAVAKRIARMILPSLDGAELAKIDEEIEAGTVTNTDSDIYRYHIEFGLVTVNEVRQRLGLEDVPDGNRLIDPEDLAALGGFSSSRSDDGGK